MRRSNATTVNETGGSTFCITVGSSQDAMEVDVVQATSNHGGEATRVSERGQVILDCESSDRGDSKTDEETGGCGDGNGASGGAGNGGSYVVSIGGGSTACHPPSVAAHDGSGTTSNAVVALSNGKGSGKGVTESSSTHLKNSSGEGGRGLESLPRWSKRADKSSDSQTQEIMFVQA